jgi:hypothetical protein
MSCTDGSPWLRYSALASHPVIASWALYLTRDPSLPSVICAEIGDPLLNPHFEFVAPCRALALAGGDAGLVERLIKAGMARGDAALFIRSLIAQLERGDPPKTNDGNT